MEYWAENSAGWRGKPLVWGGGEVIDGVGISFPSGQLMSSSSITPEPVFVNIYGAQESILPAYVAWRAGTTNRLVVPTRQAGNRFLDSLKGLQVWALDLD